MGLVLMRRPGEEIDITANKAIPAGTRLTVTLITLDRNRARLLIEAPRMFTVDRGEITERKAREHLEGDEERRDE